MKLLVIVGCVAFVASSDVKKNDTSEAKTKRGIYHLSDPNYSQFPVHHLARYNEERTLAEDASQISITYRPQEEIKPQQELYQQHQQPYEYGDATKVSSNNHYKINEPSHLTHFPNYAASQYANPIAQQTARSHDHLTLPPQHLVAPQYPYLNQKLSSPIAFYGADKHIALPANIRTSSEIKLPEYLESYTTIPIIYGQTNGHLPSLKYIQPLQKAQYNLPTAYNSLPLTNAYQPFKVSAKINVANQPQFRPLNNYKPVQPNFYQPQVFDNPIVPQLQHYIPPVQSPFDAFTKPAPVQVHPKPTPPPPPPKKEQKQNSEEEDDDEESDDEDEHREVRGGAIRHEVNDEDEFDKGYDDAARGFPAYDSDDDDRHHRYHDDEDNYERFRSKYQAERDEDDDHRGHYSTKRERSRKLKDHDDDRRGRYVERDHEGRHSHKLSKKEPKDKYHKTKTSYDASKYYKIDDDRKKPYSKYSKSKKPQSDSRYIGSSLKKHTARKPSSAKESASSRSEVELHYGFEPIKVAQEESDSVAKHSEPNHNRKLYKENWFFSKTSKSQ